MSIDKANSLEREGKLFEAFKKNIEIASNNSHELIAAMAEANARRIQVFLNSSEKSTAEELFLKYKENIQKKQQDGHQYSLISPSLRQDFPLVSIVVPCFNCEKYLLDTVKSIKEQTYQRYEVILVDDFSKDKTAEMAREISRNDKKFRFYQHRANGGLSSARNSGIRLARGEYICFLDSDDLLAPESIENRVNALLKSHEKDFVAGVFDQSVTIPENFSGRVVAKSVGPNRLYADFINMQGDCPFNANQPMLKRSVIVELGGFPEKYPQAEDWRLWSKALRAGYVFLPVNSVGSGYRQTAGSMIRRAPLLHVEKSLGNMLRSHKSYDAETDPSEIRYEDRFFSSPIFENPAGEYEAKRKFLSRLVNFTGIEYARCLSEGADFTPQHAANEINRFMPEFQLVFAGYSLENAVGWFVNGVKRYSGKSDLSNDEAEAVRSFVFSLLVLLGVESESGVVVGDASLLIPKRDLAKRIPKSVDVVFIPHKKYHTQSFELLLPYLKKHGLTYVFVDISVPYRDEDSRMESVEGAMLSYNEFLFSRLIPNSIVCMNDWDTVVKPLVRKANQYGIPTIGVVEGVQDYHDVDTGRRRDPYRTVENVFLTGSFDRRYFLDSRQKLFDVGVQRLEGLGAYAEARKRRSRNIRKTVVLNVNFSYGVMLDRREKWVKDVFDACQKNGYKLIISQHPQDDGDFSSYDVDKRPLYELLVEADVFVSRFSGAILEALVIGCPTVYFNGHQEKIDKFNNSLGAYEVADNVDELTALLSSVQFAEEKASVFLYEHAGFGRGSIVERTANYISEIVSRSCVSKEDAVLFKRSFLN